MEAQPRRRPGSPASRQLAAQRAATLALALCAASCGSGAQPGAQPGPSGPAATGGFGRGGAGGGATGGSGLASSGGSNAGGAPVGPGSGGAGPVGSGGAGPAGSGGSGASTPGSDAGTGAPDVTPSPAGCSAMGPAPRPTGGFVKADPRNDKFPFSTHWMGVFSANPRCISMTSLSDIDNDGDQDFASGQRDVSCSGATNVNAPMVWWEYCGPDHWVKHNVGTGYKSAAAGGAGDFDGDGWVDLVVGDSWFKNPGTSVRTAEQWMRYATGAPGTTEEITVGDVSGDGKLDVLYVVSSIRPQWWMAGPDATKPWIRGAMFTHSQQQGGAIGDLDGDGRNDIVVGDRWWYRADGNGADGMSMWTATPIPESPFAPGAPANGSAPLVVIGDVDGDGDYDLVVQEHWGAKVAWFANMDGKGTAWTTNLIAGPGAPFAAKSRRILHGLLANDFDNDGDIDILSGENQGTIWIYENTDGKGKFAEHVVAEGPAHEPRAADVDCDGDLDIAGKSWGDPSDGAAGRSETTRAHVYFKNELVERGGKAVFMRPKGEIWNTPDKGVCKR